MKNTLICIASAILLGLPGVVFADSSEDGVRCEKVRARAFVDAAGQGDCEFNGYVYPFCIVGEMRGSIRGTWVSYYDDGWLVDLVDTTLPEPVPFTSNYAREFEVISTSRGTLFGDGQYIFDARVFELQAPFPLLMLFTAGTGAYEGATGWMIATFEDPNFFDTATVRGRLCGPNIRGDDDDDSDDDD